MKSLSKISILLSVFVLALLSGCRSPKQAAPAIDKSLITGGVANFQSIISSYGDWSEMAVPVKMQLRQPISASISGTLTMKKDSYIHFSAKVLGLEIGSVMITGDSIFAKEKLHKIYVAESLDRLTSVIPLTIGNLQQIVFGHVFKPGASDMSGEVKLDYDDEFWAICESVPTGLYSISGYQPGSPVRFDVETTTCRIKAIATEFVNETPGPVASADEILVALTDNMFLANISFNYSKARWSGVGSKSWQTPSGYRCITSSELIKMLSNL